MYVLTLSIYVCIHNIHTFFFFSITLNILSRHTCSTVLYVLYTSARWFNDEDNTKSTNSRLQLKLCCELVSPGSLRGVGHPRLWGYP